MKRQYRVARVATAVGLFFGAGQVLAAPISGARAAAGSAQLACAKYGYSMTIDSAWTVKDPCTTTTVITTDRSFGLGILLVKDGQLSMDRARDAMNVIIGALGGAKPASSPAFHASTVDGRHWIRGTVDLKDADGNRYSFSDLETAYNGLTYHFVANIALSGDAAANAQVRRIVDGVWSSIKIGTPPAAPTPPPTPGRPVSTGSTPAITGGTWEASNVSLTQYRDATTGVNGPTNGAHVELDLSHKGRYTYAGLLQVTSYTCVDSLFAHESGTVSVDHDRITLIPQTSTLTSKDNCHTQFNYSKQGSLAKRTYQWKIDQLQWGTKLCLKRLDVAGEKPSCYSRSGTAATAPTIDPTTGASWTRRTASTSKQLRGVSCRSTGVCLAVGESGTILTSRDAGASWTNAANPNFDEGIKGITCTEGGCIGVGISILRGSGGNLKPQSADDAWLSAVTCPSSTICVAVGGGGAVLTTADGGVTWARHSSGINVQLTGVSCPSVRVCVAVGGSWGEQGTVLTSTDGGVTWARRAGPSSAFQLNGVACPSAHLCLAVGSTDLADGGVILSSVDDGESWTAHAPGFDDILQGAALNGIACTGPRACIAVGNRGSILETVDGGSTWTGQVASGGSASTPLNSISCARASACVAVGDGGIILQLRK